MKPTAVIDIPPSKRALGWGWSLGWSNHPKDIAACQRIQAEGWEAVTQTAPQKPVTTHWAAKVRLP